MGDVVMISSDEDMQTAQEMAEKSSSPSSVVRWEKYLPKMVLRVLLVEADDSTRQIITSLLRKCSYRVTAVSDGLMAWETLKGRPHDIDLILTELDLPSISGFALLTLVMEHETCKNIPVIMMSSQDSVSMVLKCMLKGAADFLIKPVRKNELKNLWRHVWRRQTLQAGCVRQSLPASQTKLEAIAENNAANNHLRDYASSAHKNGSEAQSSCYMEVEGAYMKDMQAFSQIKQGDANLNDLYYRKLAEKPKSRNELVLAWNGTEEKLDRLGTKEGHADDKAMLLDARAGPGNVGKEIESSTVTMDLIGTFDSQTEYLHSHGICNEDIAPELELSLRKFGPWSSRNQDNDEKQTQCRSNASAFSLKPSQPGFPVVASDPTEPRTPNESQEPFHRPSIDAKISSDLQGASASNNQENINSCLSGKSEQIEITYQSPKPEITFQPVFFHGSSISQHVLSTNQTQNKQDTAFLLHTPVLSDNEVHQSEETVSCSTEQNGINAGKEHELGSPVAGQSTCTNLCDDGVASHEKISACEGTAAPEGLKETVLSQDGFRGMDSLRSSQREAALTKFRLKRKDRCFEKKVRYQSRKKLAEQRPRVKGQFVRAVQNDSQAPDASCGP